MQMHFIFSKYYFSAWLLDSFIAITALRISFQQQQKRREKKFIIISVFLRVYRYMCVRARMEFREYLDRSVAITFFFFLLFSRF